ncbi:helix-turn-helix domain-containing protein [Rugamonas sp. FT107W]|uniref:Helix-turn-helix domain-containing protein n=1 Tax=Duganella vulcania TaxID=2692166 RepID=A0A845HPT4_9BURK|nr:AraC family transcriptional regulator [Duganella vulcania]MYN20647.1 helix-turn-helix domain-containing protein [Duganella vulcania]
MIDPLAEVVALLQPRARLSKVVSGAGAWRIRRSEAGQPFYCVVLDGSCRLAVDGHQAMRLDQGDFVLIPAAHGFRMSGMAPAGADDVDTEPVMLPDGEFRLGPQDVPPDVQLLVGHCAFGSPDAALLVSLLPRLVHVRGEPRLATIVQLAGDESRARRPGRDVILAHLLEVLLIEALRSTPAMASPPGLLRGLADERLAPAIRHLHEDMRRPWTVAELAKSAALSRSAFFERFSRAMGVAPMEYLLRWRMASAKHLLRQQAAGVAEVAERVGYGSASAFSVAFRRHVGLAPTRYASEAPAPA